MKLDYDCVRELLLTLESGLVMESNLAYPQISLKEVCDLMTDYNKEEIVYTTIKLIEADFISAYNMKADNGIINIFYYDITFSGHQYLNSIRNSKVWETIKKKSASLTFGIIEKLAEIYAIKYFSP